LSDIMLKIGVATNGWEPPDLLRAVANAADSRGSGSLWVASHLFQSDPITSAVMALGTTDNLKVALMAVSPFAIHPVHIAMAAATLDQYFPGRVELCLGVGAPLDLQNAGIEASHPLPAMREALKVTRGLLMGETVRFEGEHFRLSGRGLLAGRREVPIVLAASGPKMLELAGAEADGVLISAATSPAFVRWTLDRVAEGEARTGRKVHKCALVYTAVSPDEHIAHDKLRRTLAFVLRGAHHARNLELAGSSLDQQALAAVYREENWEKVDRLVTDEVMRNHAASGTPDHVAAAFAAYEAAGLDEIAISGFRSLDDLTAILDRLA
jgi:5,10-methylenetetrahydromethanopterin reductase